MIATASPVSTPADLIAAGPSPAFASVTVSTVAYGPRIIDPAAVDLPLTRPLDITAWLEL